MHWMRLLLLGDVSQTLEIGEMRGKLARHETGKLLKDQTQDRRIDDLEEENRELKLRMAVLIRLLVSRGVLSPAEIAAMVLEVEGNENPEMPAGA